MIDPSQYTIACAIAGTIGLWGVLEAVHYFRVRQSAAKLQPRNTPQPYWFGDPSVVN